MKKEKPKRQIVLPEGVYKRFTSGFGLTQPAGTNRERVGKIVRLLRGSYNTFELIKYLISIYNGGDRRKRFAELSQIVEEKIESFSSSKNNMADKKDNKINIIYTKVDELIEYEKNNKDHPEEQIETIADSIREMGFRNPILIDADNVIIAGHGRLLAAKKLGMTDVPCILVDDLTEDQIRKYRLLDNRTAELSMDNLENIKMELEELNDEQLNNLYSGVLEEDDGKLEAKEKKAEIEFTEELMEAHNYVVLYFDNEVDWITAVEKLNISTKKTPDSRAGYEMAGIGRVLKGSDVISRII